MRKVSFNDPLVVQWLGFAAIAFAVLFVYAPSLMHIPRADQIVYLAEMMDKHHFWDLTIGAYDLNRTRHFAPGDQMLFRPVLYFFLGSEKYFYGNNFLLWQLTGVGLHLAVVWQLLALFLDIRPRFSAVLAAGFFALLSSNMEMVIWDHINGYMIFLFFWVKTVRLMLKDDWNAADWFIILFGFFIMCFTYELGNIYAILIYMWAWFKYPRARRNSWVLLLPPLSYISLSLWNLWGVHGGIVAESQHIFGQPLMSTIINAIIMSIWWLWMGAFPSQIHLISAGRNIIDSKTIFPIPPLNLAEPMALIVILILFLVALSLFGKRRGKNFQLSWILWVGFMLMIFVLFLTVGRANPRGLKITIFNNIYYAYFFWLMFIVILYDLAIKIAFRGRLKVILVLMVGVLTVGNSFLLYRRNYDQARDTNFTLILMRTLDLLIAEKGGEPDFSFYVAPLYPGNFKCYNVRRVADIPDDVYSMVEILYPKYFTSKTPKYSFIASSGS